MAKTYLTPGEVADMLGASVDSVRRWADEGKLPSHRTPGGQRRFRLVDVLTFLPPEDQGDQGDPKVASA